MRCAVYPGSSADVSVRLVVDNSIERRRDGGDRADSIERELRAALYGEGPAAPGLFEQMRKLQADLAQHATSGMHSDTARRFGEMEGALADVRKWAGIYQEEVERRKERAAANANDMRKIVVGIVMDVAKTAVGLLVALIGAKLGGLF